MPVIRYGETIVGEAFSINNFAICSTLADTQIKEVYCPLFNLAMGSRISIKFTHGNTAGSCVGTGSNIVNPLVAPKISMNGSDPYLIYVGNEPAGENFIAEGDIHDFVFDGDHFVDVTSDIIYKGGNDTDGYYEKSRNKTISQYNTAPSRSSQTITLKIPYESQTSFNTICSFAENTGSLSENANAWNTGNNTFYLYVGYGTRVCFWKTTGK